MSTTPQDRRGPAESNDWPGALAARVVTPGARPRVHGYDVEGDLARHYGFGESVLLALTGEAPESSTGTCFEIALTFLSPLAVTEAPTHASVLARTCAGSAAAITGTAAVTLAEQARWLLARYAPLLAWLDADRSGELPEIARATHDDERESVSRLRQALAASGVSALPAEDFGRDAALLTLLHGCGLRTADRIEVALVVARLATCAAEALAVKRGALRDYPMNLPPFSYAEDAR